MGVAIYTQGSGYITSSVMEDADQITGIYTTKVNDETITIKDIMPNHKNIRLSSLVLFSYATPLRLILNTANPDYGFIPIPANSVYNIQAGSIVDFQILCPMSTEIMFIGTYM